MRVFTCKVCGKTGHFAVTCPKNPKRNLVGRKFGRWTVVRLARKRDKYQRWIVECGCERRTRKAVTDYDLRNGVSRSCGCAPRPTKGLYKCGRCGKSGHNTSTCEKAARTSGMRRCSICRVTKPISEFSPDNYRCRPCSARYASTRRADRETSRGYRRCTKCGLAKPATSFSPDRPQCRKCFAKYMRSYRKSRQALGIDHYRRWALRANYGLTEKQYDSMLASQGGGCAICGRSAEAVGHKRLFRLAVDHVHDTGVVRGILCADCNRGISHFADDPGRLAKATRYVRKYTKAGRGK